MLISRMTLSVTTFNIKNAILNIFTISESSQSTVTMLCQMFYCNVIAECHNVYITQQLWVALTHIAGEHKSKWERT
jgi:hypothetical protein